MSAPGTFTLVADFEPQGDQPQAIDSLTEGLDAGRRHQVLLGVTGSGKTFSMAHVIARADRPALVMAPNKTLAAQLYHEFQGFFPHNAVRYFVSYYDYYQPEAYVPQSGHLHRKGFLHQRGNRQDAPLRDQGAPGAARYHRRRQRVVHLRPGLARLRIST